VGSHFGIQFNSFIHPPDRRHHATSVALPYFIECLEDDTAKTIYPPIEIIADGENSNSGDEAMTARLAIGCTAGHVSLPPSRAKLDIVPSGGIRSLEANGTIAALNEALSQAIYTSARDNGSSGQYEACEVHVELVVPEDATIRGERSVEKFLLDIIPVNDPPCIEAPVIHRVLQDTGGYIVQRIDTLVAKEDEPLSIDLTISDVDIDPYNSADASLFTVRLKTVHGAVKLRSTVGLYFIDGADSTSAMKFRGTLTSINNALQGLQYTGAKDYHGSSTLTVQVWDEGNIGRGGELSEQLALPIEVLPVSDVSAFSLPPNFILCGEETLCTVPGVQVYGPDINSDSLVRVEATAELGRLDLMRTGRPSTVSVEKSEKNSLLMHGTFAGVNLMLESLSYHGRAGTHSRVDTIGLKFFDITADVEGEEEAVVVPAARASINVLLRDSANNTPRIEYVGAIYRDDASCAAKPASLGGPPSQPPPSSSPLIDDEGVCNRLVETKPFICSEDEYCQISGVSINDSDVLRVSLAVSHGALDVSESSLSGLRVQFVPIISHALSLHGLTMEGSQDRINNALTTLSYKADLHYHGADSLIITVSDSYGASSSVHSMVIPIATTSVDDLPKLVGPGDVLEVAEDGFIAIPIMLADVDGNGQEIMAVEISAKHGAIGFDISDQADVLDVQGTVVARDTDTPHTWYSWVEVRGTAQDLNLLAASFVFGPETDFNTEVGGYASTHMDLTHGSGGMKQLIDSGEYLVRVNSVNDAPLVSIGPRVTTNGNDTVVSTLEDEHLDLVASVADVDDTKLSVELTCSNGSMYVFKRTKTCFACDDVDDVLIDIADGGRQISMQGSIESINSKLSTIRFTPDEDYSGEASVRIVVADGHDANRAEQHIHIIPTSDSFELWMPTNSIPEGVPLVELDEDDRVLIGSEWYNRRIMLAMHSLSREIAIKEPQLIYPHRQELETPQAWSLVDKEYLSSSFCAELQVSIGTMSLDHPNLSSVPALEVKTSPDNQTMAIVGTVDSLNNAARHIVFSANTEESGLTSLNITICEGNCGWANVRPPSRGCVEAQINIFVSAQNNPPMISITHETEQPIKVGLNSKEVPIATIVVDDSDLQDNMILDPFQRRSEGFLTVRLEASAGKLSLHSLHGLSFLHGTGVLNRAFSFMGQLREVNRALSTLYFTCLEGLDGCAEGKVSVEVLVNDNGFSGTGGPLTASTNIDLIVIAE